MAQEPDPRFDAAEADVVRGDAWRFREDDAPNPLTIAATGWSLGHTKHGEAEFLNGTDRDGNPWSVLVGSVVLKKRLIEGLVEEWDDEQSKFIVTRTLGRVEPGEVVSVKYLGDTENAEGKMYPRFAVSRKPASSRTTEEPEGDDDIPW